MDPDNSRFNPMFRVLPSNVKRRLEYFDAIGVKTSKVIKATTIEHGGSTKMPCLPKNCRNHVEQVRRDKFQGSNAEAVHLLFTRMQKASRNFFFRIDADKGNRMRNVFWLDERCRAAFEEFRDVISLDSTYMLNKYKMPFVPFVGVNHHGHSILLGCALISNENADTYTWLLTTWLEAMGGRAPGAIISDQCQSIGPAIAKVFPNTKHRWCLWHILIKFPDKLGWHKKYDELRGTFEDVVYESLAVDEFVTKWNQMISEFELVQNEWLESLFLGKDKWVPVFVKDQFWAGMSSTQRSEGMNAYFDDYVHAKTSLRTFVEQFEYALVGKIEKEMHADCMKGEIRCQTEFRMELQFRNAYTHNLFKKVQDELVAMIYCEADLIVEDGVSCEYRVTERKDLSKKKIKLREYKVTYDLATEEVNCICRIFL